MDNKTCPICNTQINVDSRFCPECGYKYEMPAPQDIQPENIASTVSDAIVNEASNVEETVATAASNIEETVANNVTEAVEEAVSEELPVNPLFSQPVNQPVEQPMPNQPMNQFGQPMQGQPMNQFGQPMQGQPMNQQFGQPMQNQPMNQQFGQPMQGQPMNQQFGQPMQGQPMNQFGQPMQGQPMNQFGQPMQGQPMNQQFGQPMQGQPMNQQFGQPMQGQFNQQPQMNKKTNYKAPASSSITAFKIIGILLIVVAFVSSFLPIVSISFMGQSESANLFQAFRDNPSTNFDWLIFAALALIGLILSIVGTGIGMIISAILMGGLYFLEIFNVKDKGGFMSQYIKCSYGFYMCIVSCVVLIIVAIMLMVAKSKRKRY